LKENEKASKDQEFIEDRNSKPKKTKIASF